MSTAAVDAAVDASANASANASHEGNTAAVDAAVDASANASEEGNTAAVDAAVDASVNATVPYATGSHERWWARRGWWAVDTFNCNSWTSAVQRYIRQSNADAVVLQETRITDTSCTSAHLAAMHHGWRASHSLAWKTAADKASGGVSVLCRRGFGLQDASMNLVPEQLRHRVTIARINAIIPGGFYLVSIYLRDSEGMSAANLAILEQVAAMLGALEAPWIIGGDWNLTPEALTAANWHCLVNGRVVATLTPTCNEMIYDFFIVANVIASSVAAIQRVENAAAAPHYPIRLLLRGDAHRLMVRRLVKPHRIEAVLPHGPPNKPAEYETLCRPHGDVTQLGESVDAWYALARQEWSSLAGEDMHATRAKFRWEPVIRKRADGLPGSDRLSMTWCKLSAHAKEVARITDRGASLTPMDLTVLHSSLASSAKLQWNLPKSLRYNAGLVIMGLSKSLFHAAIHRSAAWAAAIARCAMINARKIEERNARCRLNEWKEALTASGKRAVGTSRKPSSKAYRWLKSESGWTASPIAANSWQDGIPAENDYQELSHIEDDDSVLRQYSQHASCIQAPLADQAAVELERSKWAALWKEGDSYDAPAIESVECEPLELLSSWAIKQAALTFPPGTGLGFDNIAPRALTRLTDQGLQALAKLYQAIEKVGSWTAAVYLVLIVLLPKSDGGLRPIGLFPTFIRIWMRARLYIARKWEALHQLPCVFGGPAMGAARASWNEVFVAEMAGSMQADHLQALIDLIKCFESVPHRELIEAARARGVSMTVLRLSIQAYRLARTISISGVCSALVIATRGITAGSGFATTELRVLLLDVVIEVQTRWGSKIRLTVYVDDLTLSSSGHPQRVLRAMLRALAFLVHALQEKLKMQVAPKKSFALAGRPTLSRALCSALPQRTVSHATSAKLLGADNASGRRRSTRVVQARIKQVKKSCHKYRRLRRLGFNTRLMAQTAANPKMCYGVESMGVSDSVLHSMRTSMSHLLSPSNHGKNADLVLLAHDLSCGTVDPAFNAHVAPVKAWALAWWQQWQPPERLQAAYVIAKAKIRKAKQLKCSPWQVVSGPTAALILTLERIGWDTSRHDQTTDDMGQGWSYMSDSPAAIQAAVRDSVRRWRAKRIAQAIPSLIPMTPDVEIIEAGNRTVDTLAVLDNEAEHQAQPSHSAQLSLRSCTVIPVVAPLESYLHRSKPATRGNWDPKWSSYLRSALTGGQWTQDRKARIKAAEGLTDRCQLCGVDRGTLQHRLVCPRIVPEEGWAQMPSQAYLANSKLGPDRLLLVSTRALLLALLPRPAVNEGWFEWVLEPDDRSELHHCLWFTDGSLVDPDAFPYQACGFAIVVVSPQGTLLGIGWGAPPTWIRTSAGAEAWAVRMVLSLSIAPPTMFTDCLSLLRAAESGYAACTAPDKPLARIWDEIAHYVDRDFDALCSALKWTPAHKSVTAIDTFKLADESKLSATNWRANRLVDVAARSAALRARAPSAVCKFLKSAKALLHHKAAIVAQSTYIANNCSVVVTDEHGQSKVVVRRDTTDKPPRRSATVRDQEPDPRPATRPAPSPFSRQYLAAQLQQASVLTGKNLATATPTQLPSSAATPSSASATVLVHNVDDVQLSDPPTQLSRSLGMPTGKNGATMLPTQLPSSSATVQPSAPATVLFHNVDVEQLLDPQRESYAATMLPSAQAFSLDGPGTTPAVTRNRASRDKQDIARRNATWSRHASAEQTARMVQELGDRAAASSSTEASARLTATQRLQAMRDRVRARQAASGVSG